MPAIHVARSVTINAPSNVVQKSLTNFEEWPTWSPWLYIEPEASVDYRGQTGQIGHGYDWKGSMVGAGGMTLTQNEATELKMDLDFLKPFKSHAKVRFELAERGADNTEVTWHMNSKLPFFMFFMKNMMTSMIGMDYERGLKMLKDYIENGKISSATTVSGVVDFDSQTYIGTTKQASMNQLADSMGEAFPSIFKVATENALEMSGPPMAIYNQMDLKNGQCNYTAALPITDDNLSEKQASLPNQAQLGTIVGGRALKVTHTGSYSHLGNAWSTGIGHQRHQKLKPSKQQAPFECYMNDPEDTPEDKLITEIYIPLR